MTFLDLFKSYPFSAEERAITLMLLDLFKERSPRDGSFLQQLDYAKIVLKWNPKIGRKGILGAFIPTFWRKKMTLHIASDPSVGTYTETMLARCPQMKYNWLMEQMAIVIHEATHMWQYAIKDNVFPCAKIIKFLYPVMYTVCSFPVLREYTLERDAVMNSENSAREFFTIINRDVAHYSFLKMLKSPPETKEDYTYFDEKLTKNILDVIVDPSAMIKKYNIA